MGCRMSGAKVYPKLDDGDVTDFIKKTFEKRECNRFRIEALRNELEICECGYSKDVHSKEAFNNDSNQENHLTKTFPTDAFGKLAFDDTEEEEELNWKTELKNKRYVRLDYKTDAEKILKLFDKWGLYKLDLILSVLSDSDSSTSKGNEKLERNSSISVPDIRKTFCGSLVDAAVSTNAWIITGGLDKGVDQLIGNEVKQRLMNGEKIPLAVLGISHWGGLEKKKDLLVDEKKHPLNDSSQSKGYAFDSNPTGLSLNQHHTHFLLVDDGTQKKSGCECDLRKMVESALKKSETNQHEKGLRRPLIYILIGGSINAFRIVERALANEIPVIIAMGTGGAADIISKLLAPPDGATLSYLPEITEKLFHHIEELLIKTGTANNEAHKVIANVKAETNIGLFLEFVDLLNKMKTSEGYDAERFRNDIANLKKTKTNELLAGIKYLLISKQTPSDSSNHSAANAEFETVYRMRVVFEQMLVVNGIPPQNAQQVVDDLKPRILIETLNKAESVFSNFKAIRSHNQKDLLIQCDLEKKSITSSIVEALKKVKCDVYVLAADWNDERFFKQLLLENWKQHNYENVFMKLVDKRKTKYVKLMMEQIGYSDWLTKPEGQLMKELNEGKLCSHLLKKIDSLSKRDHKEKLSTLKAKLLFIWCIRKQMPETAMLFWKQGKDCLAMVLVAYKESRKEKKKLVGQEKYAAMEEQQKYFSRIALELLGTFYADNHKNTHDLLIGETEDMGDRTPLQIAVNANFTAFISEAPVQKLLDKIWVRNIENHGKYRYAPMILSEACPLLAPALFTFRTSSDDDDDKQNDKTSQKSKSTVSFFSKFKRIFENTYCWKVKSFLCTPFVKFSYGFISYIAYLTLFSIVMLTDFRNKMSPSEMALNIWTLILIIEELNQVIVDPSAYKNEWNYLDIGALVTYIVGFILRMIHHGDPTICPDCFYVARIILAFSLMIFIFRTLQFISIGETIGPKIYMIRQLVEDLISFLLILTVFITAYGVVSNVILYPNQPLNAKLLQDVFYDAWWSLVLQFNREDALGLNCNMDNPSAIITAEYCSSTSNYNIDYVSCKVNGCPANNWIVSVLLAFYALLTVIMLLNVLIAMFNATFSTINEKQKEVSMMQRYRLLREYSSRSMVPTPLCAILYPYYIAKFSYNLCKKCINDDESHEDDKNGEQNEKQKKKCCKPRPPKAFAKNLKLSVKGWERHVVETYFKRDKDKQGWPLTQSESDQLDERSLRRYIVQQIRNQIEEQSNSKTDTELSQNDFESP